MGSGGGKAKASLPLSNRAHGGDGKVRWSERRSASVFYPWKMPVPYRERSWAKKEEQSDSRVVAAQVPFDIAIHHGCVSKWDVCGCFTRLGRAKLSS